MLAGGRRVPLDLLNDGLEIRLHEEAAGARVRGELRDGLGGGEEAAEAGVARAAAAGEAGGLLLRGGGRTGKQAALASRGCGGEGAQRRGRRGLGVRSAPWPARRPSRRRRRRRSRGRERGPSCRPQQPGEKTPREGARDGRRRREARGWSRERPAHIERVWCSRQSAVMPGTAKRAAACGRIVRTLSY